MEWKYRNIVQYVDIETGQIISKSEYERNYYKIRSTYINQQVNEYRIKKYTHECRRKVEQLKIWNGIT